MHDNPVPNPQRLLDAITGTPPAAPAQPKGPRQNPAAVLEAQQRAELVTLERTAFDGLAALHTALERGLLRFVGISFKEGLPLVELVVCKDGEAPLQFTGVNVFDAIANAGQEIHTQLVMLHEATRKLTEYDASCTMRRQLRKPQQQIVLPN